MELNQVRLMTETMVPAQATPLIDPTVFQVIVIILTVISTALWASVKLNISLFGKSIESLKKEIEADRSAHTLALSVQQSKNEDHNDRLSRIEGSQGYTDKSIGEMKSTLSNLDNRITNYIIDESRNPRQRQSKAGGKA